ncbi:MAG TPA: hypothetical protein VFC19_52035 [Candidatus Limnocylindrales bacterium]|nr:hypothetical protein [Candidatus Limnocylindrales bacterium]
MTDQPGYPADRLLRGLSLPRRIGYSVAGLAGLAGATMIGVLWATEPTPLPVRAELAFAGLIAIGLAWAVFAAWALASRPLFAIDRVVAATLAVGFSALTTTASIAVAAVRSSIPAMVATAGVGVTLTAIAAVILVRARTYRASLLARERELRDSPGSSNPQASNDKHDTSRSEGEAEMTRNRLPIGPLALAMRHHRGNSIDRRIVIAAVVLGLTLAVGLALLLLR